MTGKARLRWGAAAAVLTVVLVACSSSSPEQGLGRSKGPGGSPRRGRLASPGGSGRRQGHTGGGGGGAQGGGSSSVAQAEADRGCPTTYEAGAPDHADVTFTTFEPKGGGAKVPIKLDVYVPPGIAATPALLLIHGGGWSGGCKSLLNQEAVDLADSGFIVLAIDYRLSCTDADSPTAEQAPLCGWTSQDTDPATGDEHPALQDVRAAVSWARDHAGDYHAFNGKVGAVGGSAGASYSFLAGAGISKSDSGRPDAVGGWSAITEFGKTSDGTYTCDGAGGGSGAAGACWKAVVQYIGCDIRTDGASCASAYGKVSAVDLYTSSGPPAFIANSDGELVYVQDPKDLEAALADLGIGRELCLIPSSNLHGRGYLYLKACNTSGKLPQGAADVLQSTADFFHQYLG